MEDDRQLTYENLKQNLQKYGRSACVRSTGFGKTFMLTNLIGEYHKTLFLYPTKIIRNQVEKKLKNDNPDKLNDVTFMTYRKLIKLSEDDFKTMDYDLIIMDECHKIGANLTKIAINNLFKYNKNSHFVGSTATPNRMDSYDVISEFFDNNNVYEFTLHDAFQTGLLQKPYYVFCTEKSIDKIRHDISKLVSDKNDLKTLDKNIIEIANLYNVENIIKMSCGDKSYMKFVCFFNGFKHIADKQKSVVNWFQTAYPDYKINTITVSTETRQNKENVDKLLSLKKRNKTIDLIMCIDMLNMGYHVDDLTGVLMYRCTYSDIIYIQQLGRALSSSSTESSIVFDIVDNIDRHSLFDAYDRNTVPTKKQQQIQNGTYSETYQVTDVNGNTIDVPNNMFYDRETDSLKPKWWHNCNQIEPEDFKLFGHEATYQQLIRKVVAEPMLQRCKIAFTNHFRFWCHENNIPFPISDRELTEVYGKSKTEFNQYFYNLVKQNKFTYPLGDAELLKKSNLDLIANIWNLTADKILYELFN